MDGFLSGLIKLLFKLILLVAVVYFGFVVVTLIWNDMNNRFLSDDEESTEVVESVPDVADEDMPMLEPEPEPEPKPAPKKSTTKKKSNGPETIFDAPRECVSSNRFEVETILNSRYVIAKELDPAIDDYNIPTGLEVVFIDENDEYYTEQVIRIPSGKCARQIGVYKSDHYMYNDKTLPIVKIMNK